MSLSERLLPEGGAIIYRWHKRGEIFNTQSQPCPLYQVFIRHDGALAAAFLSYS